MCITDSFREVVGAARAPPGRGHMYDYSTIFTSVCQPKLKKTIDNREGYGKMHENTPAVLTLGYKTTILKKFTKTPCIIDGFGIKYILGKG